jgi:ketosteroid isomerase-like protein
MFSRQMLVLVISGLVLSACQPKAERAGPLTDADRSAIHASVANFTKAALAADWRAAVSIYAEDAMVLPPNRPAVQGRGEMQKFFSGVPKLAEFSQSVAEIEGRGDLAYSRGAFETVMVPPGAKTPTKNKGKVMMIWRKRPEGSWLATRLIWSSDLAPMR